MSATALDTAGPNPASYYLRLPPGYHHGRSYPVMLLFSHHTVTAETMVGLVARWADKFGYILAAPVWGNTFSSAYDWSGDAHQVHRAVSRAVPVSALGCVAMILGWESRLAAFK